MNNDIINSTYNRPITTGKQTFAINNNFINARDKSKTKQSDKSDFDKVMEQCIKEQQKLSFSNHAESRIRSRNIVLSSTDIDKLNEAVNRAESKGIKDSLLILEGAAMIVNVPNRKVVTVVDAENMRENVFTNIDGAIFVK